MLRVLVLFAAGAACSDPTTRVVSPAPGVPVVEPAPPPPAAADDISPPTPNRPLTAGEVALLRPLFGDGIPYDRVRIVHDSFPFQPADAYISIGGHVYAPGSLYLDDFSAGSLYDRAIFVHELTHVWQHANGVDLLAHAIALLVKHEGAYGDAYRYRLVAGRDLADYGIEQQASILQDYFMTRTGRGLPMHLANRGLSREQRDALYAAVLRKLLADPRYAQR